MQLSFRDRQLRWLFMEGILRDWPSPQAFEDVHGFIADLLAARSLLEMPLGVPDLTTVDISGFELLTGDVVTLFCSVDHVPVRRDSTGSPAWSHIDRIMITDWSATTS